MSATRQALLLRSLESTTRGSCVIASGPSDLFERVVSNQFSERLFYRLNTLHIVIPPLRARQDDVPVLLRYFFHSYSRPGLVLPQLSQAALRCGSVSNCVQTRLRKTSGHGKRLIVWIDLLAKERRHDHSSQAGRVHGVRVAGRISSGLPPSAETRHTPVCAELKMIVLPGTQLPLRQRPDTGHTVTGVVVPSRRPSSGGCRPDRSTRPIRHQERRRD